MESERGRAKAWPLIVYILSSGGLSVSALRLLKIFINSNKLHYLHLFGEGDCFFHVLKFTCTCLGNPICSNPLEFTYFNPFS